MPSTSVDYGLCDRLSAFTQITAGNREIYFVSDLQRQGIQVQMVGLGYSQLLEQFVMCDGGLEFQ